MTAPRYYRGAPGGLWLALLCIGAALAVWFAGRQALRTHDDTVRASIYREADAHAVATLTLQRAYWLRQRDSLTRETQRRDTVLVSSIQRVRDVLRVTDTVVVPRETVVRACTALADDCEAFRATATATIAASDSLHRADSLRVAQLVRQRVASSDSVRHILAERNGRPTWRRALVGALSVGAAAYIVGRVTP